MALTSNAFQTANNRLANFSSAQIVYFRDYFQTHLLQYLLVTTHH